MVEGCPSAFKSRDPKCAIRCTEVAAGRAGDRAPMRGEGGTELAVHGGGERPLFLATVAEEAPFTT